MFAYQERDLSRRRDNWTQEYPVQNFAQGQPIRAQVEVERVGSCQIVTVVWCSYWK